MYSITEEEDIEFEKEYERLHKRFPEANFSISLSVHEDTILSKEETIFIKISRNCYCYCFDGEDSTTPPIYIRVKKNNKHSFGITYADCIDEMIKDDFNNELCNHVFLESIKQIGNSITYDCWFGS